MRFPLRLNRKLVSEWKEAYLAYTLLKTYLSPFKIARKSMSSLRLKTLSEITANVNLEEEISMLQDFENKFSALLSSEREKITLFLDFKMNEIASDYELMKLNKAIFEKEKMEDRFVEKLREAITELFKKVSKLIEFISLNQEGFQHILRKHRHYISPFLKQIEFSSTEDIQKTLNICFKDQLKTLENTQKAVQAVFIELFFTSFTSDDGAKELRTAAHTKGISRKDTMRLSFFMGCTFTLFLVLVIIWIGGLVNTDIDASFKDIFQMFRGSLLIILYFWLLSWNVYGWTSYHINYKKIFAFNQHFSSLSQIFNRAAFFLAVWIFMYLWYIVCRERFSSLGSIIPKEYTPLLVYCTILIYFVFPSKKYLNGQGRSYMYKLLTRTFLCLCYPINFPVEWAADQLISFSTPAQDVQFTVCYYSALWSNKDKSSKVCREQMFAAGFFMVSIPYLIRVIQLFRKMKRNRTFWGNDLAMLSNYILAFSVVTVSNLSGRLESTELRYLWIALAIICTSTSYIVDLKIAWMFFEKDSNVVLVRDKRIFSEPLVYYSAMFWNFILRCSWVCSISPDIANAFSSPELFTFVIALLEIIRRAIWNMFRVEKEHIVTCSQQLNRRDPCGFPHESFTLLDNFEQIEQMKENTVQPDKKLSTLDELNCDLASSRLLLVRETDRLKFITQEQDGFKQEITIYDPLLKELGASRNIDCSVNPLHTKNNEEIRERFLSATSIVTRRVEVENLVRNFEKKLKKDLGLTKSFHAHRSFLTPSKTKSSLISDSQESEDQNSL